MTRPDPAPCRIAHDDGLVTDGTVIAWRRDGGSERELLSLSKTL